MNPLISVIITIYNREQYIEDCARSLFSQTLDNIEFIFVDDASTDNSIEVLKLILNEYPSRSKSTKIICLDNNGGVANARNVGLDNVTGEYVIHADSDDWVDLNMYELLYNKAKETNADILGCNLCHEYPNRKSIHIQKYGKTKDDNIRNLILGDIHPSLCTSLTKFKLIKSHDITFLNGLNMGEDLFFNLQLYLYAEKIDSIDIAPYHYRHTTASSSFHHTRETINSGIAIGRKIEELMKVMGRYDDFKDDIDYRKFSLKLSLIYNFDNQDNYRYWLRIFPETHKRIWKYKQLDWKLRLELWFAVNHMFFMSMIIKNILQWKKRLNPFKT